MTRLHSFLTRCATATSALLIIASVSSFTGCASGSTVMLGGAKPAEKIPVEQVRLHLTPPTGHYEDVALIRASANVNDFLSINDAEAAALEKLKEQAAEAGADGVVDIQQEVVENGTVVSSSAWGRGRAYGGTIQIGNYENRSGIASAEAGSVTTARVSRTIVFRAKAVRGGTVSTAPVTPVTQVSTGVASTNSSVNSEVRKGKKRK